MYKKPLPEISTLRRYFSYDPDTGEFRWKERPHHNCATGPIKATQHGYASVCLHGTGYLVHRLIWKMMTGNDPHPDMAIDHVNGNESDNRWENIQEITLSQNIMKGAWKRLPKIYTQRKPTGRYAAWVEWSLAGRAQNEYVGMFDTKEEALAVDPYNLPLKQEKRIEPRVRKTPYNTYECRITVDKKKRKQIGTFRTEEEALAAGWKALAE